MIYDKLNTIQQRAIQIKRRCEDSPELIDFDKVLPEINGLSTQIIHLSGQLFATIGTLGETLAKIAKDETASAQDMRLAASAALKFKGELKQEPTTETE